MTRYVLHTLVRSAVFVAVSVCFQQGWITASDDPLGQGLAAFFALAALAGAWGLVDGWWWDVAPLAVVWVTVALVVTLALPLGNQLPGPLDLGLVLSDVMSGLPITVALVAGPAIFGGAMVATLRPRRSASLLR